MFQTSVGGKVPTRTGQEKSSRAADFREKEKRGRFSNHDELPKEQGEVKELRNLTTDSFGDCNLEQNGGYQSNRGQNTRPSGVFGGEPRAVPREGPRGSFAQGQSNNQGFKDNDMGVSQGWGVGRGHPPKPKTKNRGRGRGRGRSCQTPGEGFQDVDQVLYGDNRSPFSQRQRLSEGRGSQQYQGKRGLHEGKAAQLFSSHVVDSNPKRHSTCDDSLGGPFVGDDPRRRSNRGRGQGGMKRAQSLSSFTERGDQSAWQAEAKEQSRFQQNQLLVSGLSALTTEDCLVNFIEAMSGGEVEDVLRRNDKALITLANDITGKSS